VVSNGALWDVARGTIIRRFGAQPKWVTCVAYHPIRPWVVTGSSHENDGLVQLWDVNTGQEVQRFTGDPEGVSTVEFSPEGSTLLVAGGSEFARLYDLATGRELRRFELPSDTGRKQTTGALSALDGYGMHDRFVHGARFSSGGKWIVVERGHRVFGLKVGPAPWRTGVYGIADGAFRYEVLGKPLGFSPDGINLILGRGLGKVAFCDLASGREGKEVTLGGDRSGRVVPISSTHDGTQVIAVLLSERQGGGPGLFAAPREADRTVFCDLGTGHILREFNEPCGEVFTRDDRLTLSREGVVEAATGRSVLRFERTAEQTSRLAQMLVNGGSDFSCLSCSPDGRLAAVGSFGRVDIWDITGSSLIGSLSGHGDAVRWVEFLPDGKRLLTATLDAVWLWDWRSKQLINRILLTSGELVPEFHPDGHRYYSGSALRDLATEKVDRDLSVSSLGHHEVVFSRDGNLMAVSKEKEQAFEVWDLGTGRAIVTRSVGAPITCIAIAPDGASIATGSTEQDLTRIGNKVGVVRLWDTARGTLIRRWDSHRLNWSGEVATLTFSPDGGLLISTGLDRVIAYDPGSDTPLWTVFQDPARALSAMGGSPSFSPDGLSVSLGNDGQTARLICAAKTGRVERVLEDREGKADNAAAVDFSHWLIPAYHHDQQFGQIGQAVVIWDASEGRLVRRWDQSGPLTDRGPRMRFSRDHRHLFVSDQSRFKLYNVGAGRILRETSTMPPKLNCFDLAPDGRRFAVGRTDSQVTIHDAQSGSLLDRLVLSATNVVSLEFVPGTNRLFALSDKPRVWDLESRRPLQEFTGRSPLGTTSIDFSRDGRLAALAMENSQTWILDLVSGKIAQRLKDSQAQSWPCQFSADGTKLFSSGIIWDTGSWRKLAILIDDTHFLGFRDGGRKFVTLKRMRGPDQWALPWTYIESLRVRESDSGRLVLEVDRPSSVAFSPSGDRLAYGKGDDQSGTVHIVPAVGSNEITVAVASRPFELFFSASADRLAVLSREGVRMLDGWTGQIGNLISLEDLKLVIPSAQSRDYGVDLSGDGKRLLSWQDRQFLVWDVDSRRQLARVDQALGSLYIGAARFLPGGEYVALERKRDLHVAGPMPSAIRNASGDAIGVFTDWNMGLTRDGILAVDGSALVVRGLPDFRERRRFEARSFTGGEIEIRGVWLDPKERWVIAEGSDRGKRFWDYATGKELCRILCFDDGRYVATTPDGRFDAEQVEQLQGMNWVMPDEPLYPLAAEVFLRDYYEPKLLPRLLDGQHLPDVRPLTQLNRVQPAVTIRSIPSDKLPEFVDVEITVSAGSRMIGDRKPVEKISGVYDIRLFRDGQLASRWPEPAPGDDAKPEPDPTIPKDMAAWQDANRVPLVDGRTTKSFNVRLPQEPGRKGELTAYAFNKDRVKSATASAAYQVPAGVPRAKPRAYVVGFGAAGFSDPAWDLNYSAGDARLATQELGKALKQAGHYEVVPVVLVTDRGIAGKPPRPGEASPTAANFKAVLERLAGCPVDSAALAAIPGADKLTTATPDDLVIIFASSHGYTDRKGAYYLFPSDIGPVRSAGRSIDEERDKALLDACISSGELSAWLRGVDAGQLALVVDCCHAAATVEQPGFKPGPMGSRGLGQLAYDKAMRVLAASAADDVALEALVKGEGNGLLTYALIREGLMKSEAVEPKRGLTLGSLLKYAEGRVPSLYAEVVKSAEESKGKASGTRVLVSRGAELEPLGGEELAPDSTLRRKNAFQTPALFDYARGRDAELQRLR
jgi:WD40 repeat protein